MDPPPLSAPANSAVAPPTTTSYPDSVESSPRSRKTDSWDEPPYGPTTTATHPITTSAAAAASAPAPSTKLRLMCSYGGHIVPRPHDKSLCYVGGDTRIMVVDRHTTLADLHLRLSKTLPAGKSFSLKYQLPNEDLDSLISVTTDEDLENMVDEYDRLNSSANPNSKTSRLRLFIFPINLDLETSSSIESLLENSSKSNEWFLNALNWNTSTVSSCKARGLSETSSVNCLLGLDDDSAAAAGAENHPAVKDAVDVEVQLEEGGRNGKGINNNINNNNNNNNINNNNSNVSVNNNNNNGGQDVHSVPDSPMLETSSSFGSASSSPSMANLPPIRVHSEEGSIQKGIVGLGIEEQFSQMNVGVGVNNSVQKQEDGGFVLPAATAAAGTVASGLPVVVGGEHPNRVFSDDERSEQGVPVGIRKVPQVQPQQQQVTQLQQQLLSTQFQQNKPIGVVDLPSPDSVSSDGSVTNPLSRQKPMMYHEPVVQIQSGNARVSANQIDPKASDLNSRVQMPQQVQESGYVLPSQFDQYQQLHQPQQFVPASSQYIHHHPPGAVPMYYPIYPPQQLGHASGLEHQYPVYFMPARQPQAYNLPVQQPSYSESTPAVPSSRPQTTAAMVPPSAFNPATNTTTAPKPEMAAGAYRTSAAVPSHLVQVPSSQSAQYAGYSQIHHPPQSIAPSSAATANYAYEFADPSHAPIYYTQPLAPQLAAQYQTMTSAPQVKLPEASAQLPPESIKQQVRTTQP